MDVFILDSLLRPIDVVDEFISMIWTERFAETGDFELVTLSTSANRKRFVPDAMLSIPDSKRLMLVQTIEETDDEDKGSVLKIKGKELVSITEKRVAASRSIIDDSIRIKSNYSSWSPKNLMEIIFFKICRDGEISSGDIIPFLQDRDEPSLYPSDTIPEPFPEGIRWSHDTPTLYNALVDIAKAYDIGFRMYKDPNASRIFFESYVGSDRTSAQTTLPAIIFSSDMQNLQNTTEYSDNTEEFNVIVAVYEYKDALENPKTISEIVSDPEIAFSAGGFDQKTKFVVISQLPDEDMTLVEVPAYLQQLGKEELTRSRSTSMYDGEVDQNADFVYERDYFLGDLVEVRGNNGGAAFMRVVEQIIKEDESGKSSYPSLITKTSINSGTWRSWKYDVDWSAMGSEEYWSNQ